MMFLWLFLVFYRINCACSAVNISNTNVNLSSNAELIGEAWAATKFNQLNAERNWSQLSFDDQRKLLEHDIEFQGIQIPLKYVLPADAKSLEYLRMDDVLSHKIRLGVDMKFNHSDCFKEKRFLRNKTKGVVLFDDVEMDTIIADARINKGIYLSDVPEVDIPTFSKAAAQQIKRKLPWYWIVSFDLRSVDSIAGKFESLEAVAEYFRRNLLNLTNFEEKAFHDIFTSNRVIFLVTLSADLNLGKNNRGIELLIAITRKSDNQLWLLSSVRKYDFLATLLSMKNYRQLPIKDFYWLPKVLNKREKLYARDRNEWRLELASWANVTIEKSANCDDDANPLSKTFYGMFKHYTDIMISSIVSPALTRKDIESIYYKRSLQMQIPQYRQGHLVESWFPKLPTIDFSTFNFDRSSIYRDEIDPLTAEFFVVDFFRQRFFASDKNAIDYFPTILKAILTDCNVYRKLRVFLEDLCMLFLSDTNTEELDRAVKYFRQYYSTEELRRMLMRAVYLGDMNTIKVFTKTFENNPRELCAFFNYEEGPINHAAKHHSADFLERLLKLLHNQLDVDCFRNLFFRKEVRKRNPIFLSAQERIDNFDFLLKHPIVPLSSKEKANFLVELDSSGSNILNELLLWRKTEIFSTVFKTMGQMLDKEHTTELLNNEAFINQLHYIDFELVTPDFFNILLYWSEVYSLKNETKKVFVSKYFENVRTKLFQNGRIFVVEAFWTFFEATYATTERKVFLGHNIQLVQSAMHNKDRRIFNFVKEKYDLVFGRQKLKTLIWKLMLNSVFLHYRRREIDFYWPFFEEIYPSHEERREKLQEKNHFQRTLLHRAKEEKIGNILYISKKYNELINQYEVERAKIKESDLSWYQRMLIFLGLSG